MKLNNLILTALIFSATAVSAQNAVKWDESAHNFGSTSSLESAMYSAGGCTPFSFSAIVHGSIFAMDIL